MNPHQRCLQAKVKYRNEPKQVMPKSEDLSRSLKINAIWTFDTEFPTIFNKSCTLCGRYPVIVFFKRLCSRGFHDLFNQSIFSFPKRYENCKTVAYAIGVNFSRFLSNVLLMSFEFHEYKIVNTTKAQRDLKRASKCTSLKVLYASLRIGLRSVLHMM